MQAMGNKIPPGLLVCKSLASQLSDRLQQHATVRLLLFVLSEIFYSLASICFNKLTKPNYYYLLKHIQTHKISLQHGFTGNLVTSMGKLLDRGISALMGGGGGEGKSQPHSRSSSIVGDITATSGMHGRVPSFNGSIGGPSVSPVGGTTPRLSTQHHHQSYHQQEPVQQQQQQQQSNDQQPKLLSSFMSKVASLKNVVAPPNASPNAK